MVIIAKFSVGTGLFFVVLISEFSIGTCFFFFFVTVLFFVTFLFLSVVTGFFL